MKKIFMPIYTSGDEKGGAFLPSRDPKRSVLLAYSTREDAEREHPHAAVLEVRALDPGGCVVPYSVCALCFKLGVFEEYTLAVSRDTERCDTCDAHLPRARGGAERVGHVVPGVVVIEILNRIRR